MRWLERSRLATKESWCCRRWELRLSQAAMKLGLAAHCVEASSRCLGCWLGRASQDHTRLYHVKAGGGYATAAAPNDETRVRIPEPHCSPRPAPSVIETAPPSNPPLPLSPPTRSPAMVSCPPKHPSVVPAIANRLVPIVCPEHCRYPNPARCTKAPLRPTASSVSWAQPLVPVTSLTPASAGRTRSSEDRPKGAHLYGHPSPAKRLSRPITSPCPLPTGAPAMRNPAS